VWDKGKKSRVRRLKLPKKEGEESNRKFVKLGKKKTKRGGTFGSKGKGKTVLRLDLVAREKKKRRSPRGHKRLKKRGGGGAFVIRKIAFLCGEGNSATTQKGKDANPTNSKKKS